MQPRAFPPGFAAALQRAGLNPRALATARKNPRAAASSSPDGLNGTERTYADELALRTHAGEVAAWRAHPFSLRLAKATHYQPDFLVVLADGTTEVVEIKGHWEDDARAKIKIAAALFPFWDFVAIQKKGGTFHRELIGRP